MKPGVSRRTVAFATSALVLCLLGACAKSVAGMTGQGGDPATGVTIEKTYTLLNASPFAMSAGADTANQLYSDLQQLQPDNGQTVCPGDVGVRYTVTIAAGSKELDKVTAIYGGCRLLLMGGKPYSGSGSAGQQFWKDLFAAVGPQGLPGERVSNSPPAA